MTLRVARLWLSALGAALLLGAGSATAQVPTCPQAIPAQYCAAFVHYETEPKPLDSRIADAVGVTDASQTRSIGLVIAIDHYPKLHDADVKAAAVDAERLADFLVKDQKFDEVILLRNEAATRAAIDWFLTVYLPNRALDFSGKARLLVAYSGHGTYETGTTRPAFVLSEADSLTDDPIHLYRMKDFAGSIAELSGKYFHVLTLINACYGANFFPPASGGGDPNGWNDPGAYAVTAGDTKTTVPSLIQARGSLFFDLLISGVQSGVADDEYFKYFSSYGPDGEPLQQDGIARTGAVELFLSTAFDRINHDRLNKQPGFEKLSHPYIGLAQQGGNTAGGFFFLSTHPAGAFDPGQSPVSNYAWPAPRDGAGPVTNFGVPPPTSPAPIAHLAAPAHPAAALTAAPATTGLPGGPISSLKGHPEIKVFKPPEIYPIRGYDLSSADGAVRWDQFAAAKRPTFMYARAIGWAGRDIRFEDRWKAYQDLGVDRGVYLKFDFCRMPAEQVKQLVATAPPDFSLLPVGIELVTPQKQDDARQFACWKANGADAGARNRIFALAGAVETAYGKTPLMGGNAYNLGRLTDARFDRYMLWLHAYGKTAGALKLAGRNPWTLWQYSGDVTVAGIGPNTTANVFFGARDQYEAFKGGQGNAGLVAAQ